MEGGGLYRGRGGGGGGGKRSYIEVHGWNHKGLAQLMALSAINWPAQKEMQNFGGLQESERRSRKMKGQGDEQCNLRNFCNLRKFRNLEIFRLKNCSPSPL